MHDQPTNEKLTNVTHKQIQGLSNKRGSKAVADGLMVSIGWAFRICRYYIFFPKCIRE